MKNDNKSIYLFIGGVSILGYIGIIIYSSIKNDSMWIWMSSSLIISLAAFFIGGLIGFLFGVPKFNTKYNPAEEREYLANTSLEQISEWLTKIIIGVGLTQLIVIPRNLQLLSIQIVQGIVCKHECPPEDTAFILSLILLFFILGFFFAFFYARLELNDKFVKASALSKVQNDLITVTEISASSSEKSEKTTIGKKDNSIEPLKIEDFKKKLTSFQKDILKQLVNSPDRIYRQPSSIFRYNEFNEFLELVSLKILKRAHPGMNSYILTDDYLGLTTEDLK